MDWTPIAIALGAVPGALSRYYLTLLWIEKRGLGFPYGTLFVNLTGAYIIGVLSTLFANFLVSSAIQRLVLVGYLGAYTTFSTFILDSVNLFRGQRALIAILYWLGTPLLGFICVQLGILSGQRLVPLLDLLIP
jgi:CrcB protein